MIFQTVANLSKMLIDNSATTIENDVVQKTVKDLDVKFTRYTDWLIEDHFWKREDAFLIEIKKSFLRGIFRYDPGTERLLQQIISSLKTKHPRSANLSYYTRMYPIIHLGGDSSEVGPFHMDQVGKQRLFTCWTPLTKYHYSGLSYLKFGGLWFLKKKLVKSIKNPSVQNLPTEQAKSLIWGGGFVHKGNLNTSSKISSALVIRITDEPLTYEPARNLKKDSVSVTSGEVNYNQNEMLAIFSEFQELINFGMTLSTGITKNNILEKCSVYLNDHPKYKNQSVSFALSILAQRFIERSDLFSEDLKNIPNLPYVLDILSLLTGSENLISFYRTLPAETQKRQEFLDLLNEMDTFNIIPKKSYQWKKLIGDNTFSKAPVYEF